MEGIPSEREEIELTQPVADVSESGSVLRSRPLYLLWAAVSVAAGLLWRSRFLPLPPFLSKYGGDALWTLVVFFGLGFLFTRISTLRLALASLGVSWAIEFSQLYHAPWIDGIRAMRLGRLVLGSTFNPPDLIAYAVGVALAALLEKWHAATHKEGGSSVHPGRP